MASNGESGECSRQYTTTDRWKIEVVALRKLKTHDCIKSPIFKHDNYAKKYEWQFVLQLNNDYNPVKEFHSSVYVNFKIFDKASNTTKKVDNYHLFENNLNYKIDCWNGRYSNSYSRSFEMSVKNDDTLSVDNSSNLEVCSYQNEVYVKPSVVHYYYFTFKINFAQVDNPDDFFQVHEEEKLGSTELSALKDYGKLFLNEELHDVVLSVQGKKLYAHKTILSIRSPVFRATFAHGTVETKTNVVEIEDVDYEVFVDFLRFIYTGKVENLDKKDSLLVLANRYELNDLLAMCDDLLCKELNVDNAGDMFELAATHNAPKLLQSSIDLLCDNVLLFKNLDLTKKSF